MKRILLISGNYFPELTGIGKYNSEMMQWLADDQFECTVISTYPYYPYWKVQPPFVGKNKWYSKEYQTTPSGKKITIYRCPHYVPSKPRGRTRALLDMSFCFFAGLRLITFLGKKFDYVIEVSPPLAPGVLAGTFKSLFRAKFLYHVQDLQVDVANDLKMISSMRFLSILFKIEKYILKRADKISTISEGMAIRLRSKSYKPIYLFPNWANTKLFFPLKNSSSLKATYGFNVNVPVVLYSGSIGEKQGLDCVLDVAEIFIKKNIPVQFVICGSGPYKDTLEQRANDRQIKNMCFLPLQPYDDLNEFLNMADVHLIIQKANVADHVMPSKLTTVLSVGGLVIATANKDSGLYQMIVENNLGLVCHAEDSQALYETIDKALHNNYSEIRANARAYAEQFLSVNEIMLRYKQEVIGIKDDAQL